MIVLLKAPALADRLAAAGGLATSEQERRWTATALASQKLLVSRLSLEGVAVQPEYSYTRTVNGFSAAFDANGLAVLERAPEIAGVYPVRAAYPATASRIVSDLAPGFGHPPQLGLSDIDGRGVTIALLDTGVDRSQPFLAGKVTSAGIDIVGDDLDVLAAPNPDDSAQLEQHGTEMAGLIVGSGGPGGMAGVAPGATLLPIRVAGWQRDASAHWSVYARTDQVLAGLERAVDPNGDGDAHDAARAALVALSEPFAAFTDGPLARATEGAMRLDTLVVAAAGNDGPSGPSFGSISGPGGAPAALTVGAADLRSRYDAARVEIRAGVKIELDRLEPLAGARVSGGAVDAGVGVPRLPTVPAPAIPLVNFFDRHGLSLVASRAALVPIGGDPAATVANAAQAGARAVVFYGGDLPPGAIGPAQSTTIPAVSIPSGIARTVLARLAAGIPVTVSIGSVRTAENAGNGRVASFSSTGLAFDGRVKPELVAPGVGLATAQPGRTASGARRYGTVNGTSAAAALVAGDIALLAQARPDLDAAALKGLLVGSARPLRDNAITAQGSGLVDVGGAAATEFVAEPSALALGEATGPKWKTRQEVELRNVSSRALSVSLEMRVERPGAASVLFRLRPTKLSLRPGRTVRVTIDASLTGGIDGDAPVQGALIATPLAGRDLRVPWVIAFGLRRTPALASVRLSAGTFTPSDTTPALLSFVAGAVSDSQVGSQVRPLSRVDLQLWSPTGGLIGLLARLRDVLPGRYSYGVTGRDPTGSVLPSGDYSLRLIAYPTDNGQPTVRTIAFRIE
jgi:subtilisin family serine protease